MTIHWKAVEQYFTVEPFVTFVFGRDTVRSERVKGQITSYIMAFLPKIPFFIWPTKCKTFKYIHKQQKPTVFHYSHLPIKFCLFEKTHLFANELNHTLEKKHLLVIF